MKIASLSRLLQTSAMALLVAAFAPTAKADEPGVSSKDKTFIQNAYQDGLAEVAGAQMAAQKTGNPDVKGFAEKLANDHTASNNELKALADAKKVSTATEPSIMAKGKSKILEAKAGVDFDKAYIDAMISDHKKDIAAFEKAGNDSQDTDVKSLISKTLPTLKAHLAAAETIQAKIGK